MVLQITGLGWLAGQTTGLLPASLKAPETPAKRAKDALCAARAGLGRRPPATRAPSGPPCLSL